MATGRIPSQFAYDGDKTSLPLTDSRGYLNWKDGYTADYERRIGTDLNAKAVERSKYNYILALITENLKQWQDQAFPDWRGVSVGTEDQTYAINSVVRYTVNGILYRAIQAVPSGVLPTNTTYWEVVPTSSWITSMSPMPSGGGDPSKEIVTVTGGNLNNYASGTWEFSGDAAAGTSNTPTNVAALLISKAWSVSGTNYRSQQWLSTDGTEWVRSMVGASWSPWTRGVHQVDISATGLFGATKVTDLNSATNTGFYQFASSAANIPWAEKDGGLMYVCSTNAATSIGIQLAIQATSTASDLTPWVRHFNGSTYTAWQRTPLMASIPMPYGGDAGTGLITVATDFNTIPNGTFEMTAAAAAGSQNSPMSNRCLIECKVWTDVKTRSMQRVTDITANRIYSRSFDGTSWSVWVSDYNPNYKPTPADIGAVPYATFSDWGTTTAKGAVVGMLTWQQYGSGYVVFDASKKVAPNGAVVSNTDAYAPWVPQSPILVGWNGVNTCGVRVDSARVADSAASAESSSVTSSWNLENTSTNADGQTFWPVTINSSAGSNWWRLCTLPKTGSTFDSIMMMVSAGGPTTSKVNFMLNMGNRDGFHWSGYCDSQSLTFMAAWQQADGSVIVGMYLQQYHTADILMKWIQGSGITPEVGVWTPTGTKIWASDANKIPMMWHTNNLPVTVSGNDITGKGEVKSSGSMTAGGYVKSGSTFTLGGLSPSDQRVLWNDTGTSVVVGQTGIAKISLAVGSGGGVSVNKGGTETWVAHYGNTDTRTLIADSGSTPSSIAYLNQKYTNFDYLIIELYAPSTNTFASVMVPTSEMYQAQSEGKYFYLMGGATVISSTAYPVEYRMAIADTSLTMAAIGNTTYSFRRVYGVNFRPRAG